MMKKILLSSLGLFFASCDGAPPPLSSASSDWHIQEVTSPQGVTAWLIEDHSLPIITFAFTFKGAGSRNDGSQHAGLASFTTAMLDEGAGTFEANEFQKQLEERAIQFSVASGRDSISGHIKTLRTHYKEATQLVSLAFLEPRFDDDAIERVKRQWLTSLQRQKERPATIAFKKWYEVAFGSHPYANPTDGTEQTIAAITRPLLRQRMNFMAKSNLIIGVSGAITPQECAEALDTMFGGLPEHAPATEDNPPLSFRIADIKMADFIEVSHPSPQTKVVFGINGLERRHKDYLTLRLISHVLGGGSFSSRLMKSIREERGLVYSVGTWLEELEEAPLLMGTLATSPESLDEALAQLRHHWQDMAEHGLSKQELRDAKDYLLASLPLRLTSRKSLADFLTALQYHELGMDYLQQRRKLIEAITLEDSQRVAQMIFAKQPLIIGVGLSSSSSSSSSTMQE